MTHNQQDQMILGNGCHIEELMKAVQALLDVCEALHTRIGVLEEEKELFGKTEAPGGPKKTVISGPPITRQVTIREFANWMSVSVERVHTWIQDGKVCEIYSASGNAWLYEADLLDKIVVREEGS